METCGFDPSVTDTTAECSGAVTGSNAAGKDKRQKLGSKDGDVSPPSKAKPSSEAPNKNKNSKAKPSCTTNTQSKAQPSPGMVENSQIMSRLEN